MGARMSLLDNLIAWARKEKSILERQIEMMEAGMLQIAEMKPGHGRVDTTAESLARAKRHLSEIDALLNRHRAR